MSIDISNRNKGELRMEIIEREGEIHLFSVTDPTIAIASCYCEPLDEETKANAAFIVTACNNYESLLEALKGLYNFNLGKKDYLDILLNKAEAAIQKAEQQ